MVQLNPQRKLPAQQVLKGFNSKMVQLNHKSKVYGKQASLFQFQNGSIKSNLPAARALMRLCFNSKMVQLNRKAKESEKEYVEGFNSKMVQLNLVKYSPFISAYHCFNSKMVQLNPWACSTPGVKTIVFQFQNGSIKSLIAKQIIIVQKVFQFQNGSIKSIVADF